MASLWPAPGVRQKNPTPPFLYMTLQPLSMPMPASKYPSLTALWPSTPEENSGFFRGFGACNHMEGGGAYKKTACKERAGLAR